MELNKQERIILRDTFLFHHMSTTAYLDFSTRTQMDFQRLHCRAGEAVVIPQQPEHHIGIVITGRLRASQEPKLPDAEAGEGFVIGALDLFSNAPPELPPITALEDSDLLLISARQMRQLFERFPEIMMRYINFLTGQAHAFRQEHTLAATLSGEKRLMQFLAMNLKDAKDGRTITLPYSMSVLAGRLSMSRASLYRIFDRLEESGLLRRKGKALEILHPELLSDEKYV